jgi:MYXO-CTERM domain-containing protein
VLPPAGDNEEPGFGNMMWPALAAGLALLAGLFFIQRRRRTALAGDSAVLERASLAEAPEPPAPAPVPVRRPVLVKQDEDEGPQPALELKFKPDRMVATDSQAIVHFKLEVLNSGQGPARNVRIEARMFSASAQQNQEIAAFLATPCEIEAAPLTLVAGQGGVTEGAVMMERQNVREIRIDGRPLFIPTVVVRAVYQWGKGRSSQVHGTYLVGIENQKSPEKMGPFRLDMGPRIYRSVGGRQIELARAAQAR